MGKNEIRWQFPIPGNTHIQPTVPPNIANLLASLGSAATAPLTTGPMAVPLPVAMKPEDTLDMSTLLMCDVNQGEESLLPLWFSKLRSASMDKMITPEIK